MFETTLEKKYLTACYEGDIDTVTYMIKKEGTTIKYDNFFDKCLAAACDGDRLNVCKIILNYRNVTAFYGDNHFIYHACKAGKLQIVKFYLKFLVVNKRNLIFLLYSSCGSGNANLIKFIINKIDDSLQFDPVKCLRKACESGNMESVKLFVGYICTDKYGWSGFLPEACKGGNIKIVKLVIKKGASNFRESLEKAGEGGSINIVNLLIDKIKNAGESLADIMTAITPDIEKCVYGACREGHLELFKFLLKKLNILEHQNKISNWLTTACIYCSPKIVKFIVD